MPLVRRYAVMNTEEVKVSQNFTVFITVNDQTGKRLPDYLLAAADKLGLRKGQAYDNEKNGPYQGCTSAHPPLPTAEPFSLCGSNSLNFVLRYAVKCT